MTNREFFNEIVKNENLSEEIINFAKNAIEKIDIANSVKRNKPTKKTIENSAIIETIIENLNEEPKTASTISEILGISVQKASSLLRQIVNNGKAKSIDVKIPGKGTCKAYSIVNDQ